MDAGDELRNARGWAYESDRPDVRALVPQSARRVLDAGCATGAVGAALRRDLGAEVVGLEVDAQYAAEAAGRLDAVHVGDLEVLLADEDLVQRLGLFDVVIAADVLEHLRDPWTALARLAAMLEPGGAAVVSLPNVRHWSTFWALGRWGVWPREPAGIFDATHVRWFTLADALALVEGVGLAVIEVSPRWRARRRLESRWDALAAKTARTPLKGFLAYQYVIAARRP